MDKLKLIPLLPRVWQLGDWMRPSVWGQSRVERVLRAVYNKPETEGSPDATLAAIEGIVGSEVFLPIIGHDKGEFLRSAVVEHEPELVLELGALVGYSTVLIAKELQKLAEKAKGGKKFHLYSVELDPLHAAVSTKIIERAGLRDYATVVVGPSTEQIRVLKDRTFGDRKLDMVFFDHAKDLYVPDLKLIEELGMLRPGSVLVADNIFFPGAPEYKEYVESSPDYSSELHRALMFDRVEDGVEVSVRVQ